MVHFPSFILFVRHRLVHFILLFFNIFNFLFHLFFLLYNTKTINKNEVQYLVSSSNGPTRVEQNTITFYSLGGGAVSRRLGFHGLGANILGDILSYEHIPHRFKHLSGTPFSLKP